MKKNIIFLSFLVFCLFLTGCGRSTSLSLKSGNIVEEGGIYASDCFLSEGPSWGRDYLEITEEGISELNAFFRTETHCEEGVEMVWPMSATYALIEPVSSFQGWTIMNVDDYTFIFKLEGNTLRGIHYYSSSPEDFILNMDEETEPKTYKKVNSFPSPERPS